MMVKSEAYELAEWFVKEIRGEGFYYPRDKANISQVKLILSGDEDKGIKPYTAEQFKECALWLRDGCHVTDYVPIHESKDYGWMCDENGMKGVWVVRRLLFDFYDNPPDPPPWWDPEYDNWVRLFGRTKAEKLEFDTYQGWDYRGPQNSGIPPEEFVEIFGKLMGPGILKRSLKHWESIHGVASADETSYNDNVA